MNPSYFKDNVNDMKRVWRHTGFSSGVQNFSLVGSGVSLDHLNHFSWGRVPQEMIEMVSGDSLPTQEKVLPPMETLVPPSSFHVIISKTFKSRFQPLTGLPNVWWEMAK